MKNEEMYSSLRDQLLQQAHDMLDTCEAIGKFTEPEIVKVEVNEGWHDWETEKPLIGERVVIETENSMPYFMEYFGQKNEKVKRWFRLPK